MAWLGDWVVVPACLCESGAQALPTWWPLPSALPPSSISPPGLWVPLAPGLRRWVVGGEAKASRSLPGSGQGNILSSDGGKSHGRRFRGGSFIIPWCWHGSWSSLLSPCNDIACTGDDVWPHYQSLIGLLHSFTFSFSLAFPNCFLSSSPFLSQPGSDSSLKALLTCFESKLIISFCLVFFMLLDNPVAIIPRLYQMIKWQFHLTCL